MAMKIPPPRPPVLLRLLINLSILIAANRDEQWVSLALHIGRPELLDYPDYVTREMRKAHRHALLHEIETVLTTRQRMIGLPN